MVLRPNVGTYVAEPHATTHHKGEDDELLIRNLSGYEGIQLHKEILDTLGASLERSVRREIDLFSHPDPDGSVRYVTEEKSLYRRINGSWVKVSLSTSEINQTINGKVSNELSPVSVDQWESGSISENTGDNITSRPQSLRMKNRRAITKGEVYTLSDRSTYPSAVGEVWLMEYDGGTFKTTHKIPRGGEKTFNAVGDEFRIVLQNMQGTTVQPYFLEDPDKRVFTQFIQGNQRSNSSLSLETLATREFVESHTPDTKTTYSGGKNLLNRYRSEDVSAESGRNFEVLSLDKLPIGEYVISFSYEIVNEVNKITDGFLIYQGGSSIGIVPLRTVNGRTYYRFNIEEKHHQNSSGFFIYAGHGAGHGNPNHVIFKNIMIEKGGVASLTYKPSEEAETIGLEAVNANLLNTSTANWEQGSFWTSNGAPSNPDGNPRIRTVEPVIVEKGATYTMSDKTDSSIPLATYNVLQYENGVLKSFKFINKGESYTFTAEGNEVRVSLSPPDGDSLSPDMMGGTGDKIRLKLEQGSHVTQHPPVLDSYDNRIGNAESAIKSNAGVSLLNYKHMVKGTNDWTDALVKALDENMSVFIPSGEYVINSSIQLKSGQTVYGEGKSTKIISGVTYIFNASGSIGSEVNLSSRVSPQHSNEINLSSVSGLKSGDWLMLRSAANCLMPDGAGEEWLLGSGTGTGLENHQTLSYGEYVCVENISGRTVTLNEGLTYPEYDIKPTSGERYPARQRSTAAKVDFVTDVTVKDMTILNNRAGYGVRFSFARNCHAIGIHVDSSGYTSGYSGVIQFSQCLDCEISDSSFYMPKELEPANYYYLNVYKIVSSQSCGIVRCSSENAAQTADLTFLSSYMPNTQCYIKDNRFYSARDTGLTTHGGNYLTIITGNIIRGVSQGIGTRGRGGLISNNVLIGNTKARNSNYSYAIGTYQGGSGDTIISNNVIRGFGRGYQHLDEGAEPRRITFSGTILEGNTISECRIPVHIFRMWTGATTRKFDYMGIQIKNNLIKMQNNPDKAPQSGIYVGRLSAGIIVRGNVIRGLKGSPFDTDGLRSNNYQGVTFEGDNQDCSVIDNTFINIDTAITNHGKLTEHYPSGVNFKHGSNEFIDVRFRTNLDDTVRNSTNF